MKLRNLGTHLLCLTGFILSSPLVTLAAEAPRKDKIFMEPSPITTTFIIGYIIICLILGIWASKYAKTPEQFFGSTKLFGPITIGLASMAAIMSAFGFIGGPGLVYQMGFSSVWMTMAAGIGFAYGFWLIGKRMRAMAEVTSVATLPDIARVRYQSQVVRGLLAIGLLIASIAYLSSQVKGGMLLVVQMLGVSDVVAILILFGVVTVYMVFGGMSGHIMTNYFQGIVMLIGVVGVVLGYFFITSGASPMEVIQAAESKGPKLVDGIGTAPLNVIVIWSLVFFIGVIGQPQLLTKCYTVKDPNGLKLAGVIGGCTYAICSILWILVGVAALYLVTSGQEAPLVNKDNAAFMFLSHTSGVVQALVMAGLLAAIMSTADLFVSMAGSSITRDLLGALGYEIPHDRQVFWGRVVSVLATLGAIGVAFSFPEGVAILGTFGWGFFVSANLPVFVLGFLWKRTSREGVIVGLILAIAANLVLTILRQTGVYKLPYYDYMLSIVLSMGATIFISLFTSGAAGKNLPEPIKPIFKL